MNLNNCIVFKAKPDVIYEWLSSTEQELQLEYNFVGICKINISCIPSTVSLVDETERCGIIFE